MTRDEQRPDLDQAARLVAESRRRAEQDAREARERARSKYSLAAMLRRLREENGFEAIMNDAFGGRRD
ncbi:hypothetical protein DQ384_05520 [Sphaerisporangium album]|uniref:Uncharacterized protein n=1 Tax=Sphaerisporangium album TaxID=509200 RepID=A0A367FQ88_9ACTN|nr:hypothetical protein [Sphaerisporangium album]RCG32002.1 hypothetical protein DQ384_05520 [Sphaerisporangium album]